MGDRNSIPAVSCQAPKHHNLAYTVSLNTTSSQFKHVKVQREDNHKSGTKFKTTVISLMQGGALSFASTSDSEFMIQYS